MSKNKVEVRIHGQEYKLMSEDSHEYMQVIAKFLDNRMADIAKGNKKLSTAMVAVLAALNVADDYFKLKEAYEQLKLELEHRPEPTPQNSVQDGLKKLDDLKLELDKRDQEYEHMINRFEELMQSSSIYEEELDSLRQKLSVLSHELHAKEKQLLNSGDNIKRLELEVDALKGKREHIEMSE